MRGICAYWEGKGNSALIVTQGGLLSSDTDHVSIRDELATFSLYLTRKQAIALATDLAGVLNVPCETSLDNAAALEAAALESLIVARDHLLDACSKLGIHKESESNHESV